MLEELLYSSFPERAAEGTRGKHINHWIDWATDEHQGSCYNGHCGAGFLQTFRHVGVWMLES